MGKGVPASPTLFTPNLHLQAPHPDCPQPGPCPVPVSPACSLTHSPQAGRPGWSPTNDPTTTALKSSWSLWLELPFPCALCPRNCDGKSALFSCPHKGAVRRLPIASTEGLSLALPTQTRAPVPGWPLAEGCADAAGRPEPGSQASGSC